MVLERQGTRFDNDQALELLGYLRGDLTYVRQLRFGIAQGLKFALTPNERKFLNNWARSFDSHEDGLSYRISLAKKACGLPISIPEQEESVEKRFVAWACARYSLELEEEARVFIRERIECSKRVQEEVLLLPPVC